MGRDGCRRGHVVRVFNSMCLPEVAVRGAQRSTNWCCAPCWMKWWLARLSSHLELGCAKATQTSLISAFFQKGVTSLHPTATSPNTWLAVLALQNHSWRDNF